MNTTKEVDYLIHKNMVDFQVSGRYALFTDPITRIGGEKATYQIPTYQALKGILESVYWKPTLIWVIDRVRVMNPIITESKHIRPINYNDGMNTLSVYTYLVNPVYQVQAHFIWNENRPEFKHEQNCNNEYKHYFIAKRMIERGGRRDIFLGTRECQGYVEPCVFGEGKGAYDNSGVMTFGLAFHGFNYPDETGRDVLGVRFWRPVMINGIVEFIPPDKCDRQLCRDIRPMKKKQFDSFTGLDEPALKKLIEEVEVDELDKCVNRDL